MANEELREAVRQYRSRKENDELDTTTANSLKLVLQSDLCAVKPDSTLPSSIAEVNVLSGVHLLQVDEALDLTEPVHSRRSDSGKSKPQRMLRLKLTDGSRVVHAIERVHIASLTLASGDGMKLVLKDAPVRRGIVLLAPENFALLGGFVHALQRARAAACKRETAPPGCPAAETSSSSGDGLFEHTARAAWGDALGSSHEEHTYHSQQLLDESRRHVEQYNQALQERETHEHCSLPAQPRLAEQQPQHGSELGTDAPIEDTSSLHNGAIDLTMEDENDETLEAVDYLEQFHLIPRDGHSQQKQIINTHKVQQTLQHCTADKQQQQRPASAFELDQHIAHREPCPPHSSAADQLHISGDATAQNEWHEQAGINEDAKHSGKSDDDGALDYCFHYSQQKATEFPPPPDIDEDALPPPMDSQVLPSEEQCSSYGNEEPAERDDVENHNDCDVEASTKQSSLGYLVTLLYKNGNNAKTRRIKRYVKNVTTVKLRKVLYRDATTHAPLDEFSATINVRDGFGKGADVNICHSELALLLGTGSPMRLVHAFDQMNYSVRLQTGLVARFLRNFTGDVIIVADMSSQTLTAVRLLPDEAAGALQRPSADAVEQAFEDGDDAIRDCSADDAPS